MLSNLMGYGRRYWRKSLTRKTSGEALRVVFGAPTASEGKKRFWLLGGRATPSSLPPQPAKSSGVVPQAKQPGSR